MPIHNKTRKKKKTTNLRKYFDCIHKEHEKQIKKKEYKSIYKIQRKIKHNAKLHAPRIIININKHILRRDKDLPSKTIKKAEQMIKKGEKDLKKNKKKKLKKLTKKELKLLKHYHKELRHTVKTKC